MTTIPAKNLPAATETPDVFEHGGKILTTSLAVAEYFHKTHDNVLKKIRSVITECDPEYHLVNFNETSYTRENPNGGKGISTPMFELTRDAFVLIVMGFTGKRALQWKIDYINAFNRMEATLNGMQELPEGDKVASRIMVSFDRVGNVLFTETVPRDAIVGNFDKFRWFAEKSGYLVVREDQLIDALRGTAGRSENN